MPVGLSCTHPTSTRAAPACWPSARPSPVAKAPLVVPRPAAYGAWRCSSAWLAAKPPVASTTASACRRCSSVGAASSDSACGCSLASPLTGPPPPSSGGAVPGAHTAAARLQPAAPLPVSCANPHTCTPVHTSKLPCRCAARCSACMMAAPTGGPLGGLWVRPMDCPPICTTLLRSTPSDCRNASASRLPSCKAGRQAGRQELRWAAAGGWCLRRQAGRQAGWCDGWLVSVNVAAVLGAAAFGSVWQRLAAPSRGDYQLTHSLTTRASTSWGLHSPPPDCRTSRLKVAALSPCSACSIEHRGGKSRVRQACIQCKNIKVSGSPAAVGEAG